MAALSCPMCITVAWMFDSCARAAEVRAKLRALTLPGGTLRAGDSEQPSPFLSKVKSCERNAQCNLIRALSVRSSIGLYVGVRITEKFVVCTSALEEG